MYIISYVFPKKHLGTLGKVPLHVIVLLSYKKCAVYVRNFVWVFTGSILSSGFGCDCDELFCRPSKWPGALYRYQGIRGVAPADHLDKSETMLPRNHGLVLRVTLDMPP